MAARAREARRSWRLARGEAPRRSESEVRVAATIEGVLDALGYELTTTGPAAVGLLHAVHEYGTLGSLIGSDSPGDGYKERLIAEVLRTLIRPVV